MMSRQKPTSASRREFLKISSAAAAAGLAAPYVWSAEGSEK